MTQRASIINALLARKYVEPVVESVIMLGKSELGKLKRKKKRVARRGNST